MGRETAIVPIGLSCQPTAQLFRLKDAFSQVLGETIKCQSSFLNWVICTPDGVAEFFERYRDREITTDRLVVERRLVLKDAAVWLMHEHPPGDRPFRPEDVAGAAAKFEHLRRKLFALRGLPRRVFVICQADNNLTVHYMWREGRMDFAFSRARLNRIKAALDRAFPEGLNRLVAIALRGRTRRVDWSYATAVFEPDNSEWRGDDAQWSRAVEGIAHARPRMAWWPESWRRPPRRVSGLPRRLTFAADDERLKSAVGRRAGGRLRLEGAQGCGLFGPYVRLAPGFYEAAILFESADIGGAATMDVACGLDTKVVARGEVFAGALSGREARLRAAFDGDSVNVEVRLWCETGFTATVERVTITRAAP